MKNWVGYAESPRVALLQSLRSFRRTSRYSSCTGPCQILADLASHREVRLKVSPRFLFPFAFPVCFSRLLPSVAIVGRRAEATHSRTLASQRPALQFVAIQIGGDRNNRTPLRGCSTDFLDNGFHCIHPSQLLQILEDTRTARLRALDNGGGHGVEVFGRIEALLRQKAENRPHRLFFGRWIFPNRNFFQVDQPLEILEQHAVHP